MLTTQTVVILVMKILLGQGETLEVVDGINTPLLVVGTDGSVLPTSIQVTNPDTLEVTSLEKLCYGICFCSSGRRRYLLC